MPSSRAAAAALYPVSMTSQSASRTVIRSASNAALAAAHTLAAKATSAFGYSWTSRRATSSRQSRLIVAKRDHAHRRRCACHVQLQQVRTVGLAHVQQPVVGVVQPACSVESYSQPLHRYGNGRPAGVSYVRGRKPRGGSSAPPVSLSPRVAWCSRAAPCTTVTLDICTRFEGRPTPHPHLAVRNAALRGAAFSVCRTCRRGEQGGDRNTFERGHHQASLVP